MKSKIIKFEPNIKKNDDFDASDSLLKLTIAKKCSLNSLKISIFC